MITIDDFKSKEKLQFPIVIRPSDYYKHDKIEYVIWDFDVVSHTSSFSNSTINPSKYLAFYKGNVAFQVLADSEIVNLPLKESKLIHFGADYVTDSIESVRKHWAVKFKKNDSQPIEAKGDITGETMMNSDGMIVREVMSVDKAIEDYGYLPDNDLSEAIYELEKDGFFDNIAHKKTEATAHKNACGEINLIAGTKQSEGKLNYELDFAFITQMAERMAQNKGKYEPYNWKKPIPVEGLKQALFRHVMAFVTDNTTFDDGREYGHLESIALNVMMINYQLKHNLQNDKI